jgi:hypothetical protein
MREGRRTFFKRKQKLDKLFNWTVASWFDVHRAKLNHVDELLVRVGGGGLCDVESGNQKPYSLLAALLYFLVGRFAGDEHPTSVCPHTHVPLCESCSPCILKF